MKKHLRILNKLPIFHVKEVEKSDKNVISNFLNWVNFFFFNIKRKKDTVAN